MFKQKIKNNIKNFVKKITKSNELIDNNIHKIFTKKYELVKDSIIKNFMILKNKEINPMIGYYSISLVFTLMLLINMNQYIEYINIKYSKSSYILENYKNKRSELIGLDDNKKLSEEIDLNSAKEIDNISGKITSWGGKTLDEVKNNEVKIEPQKVNNENQSTETKTEPQKINDETKNIEVKTEPQKINDETKNTEIKTEPIKVNSDIVINTPKNEVIKITNNDNDKISISINNEIENQLKKLNNIIFNGFKIKVLKDDNLVLENGIWYTYIFDEYHNFGKGIIPSIEDLKVNGLSQNDTILLLDENIGASYVTNYKKVKLISDDIISEVTNKHNFLIELSDDKKFLQNDTDELFISLKNDTNKLTKGLTKFQKVQKIYNYILNNTNYSKVFDINNKYIFSGIYTYKNNDGICSGYAKLDLYMLSFAGIENVKVVRGNILDAPDFPNIGHAWVKIGDRYYDPTFDDTGNFGSTKSYNEYKYFGLPKDLFYTNRFDYGTLPIDLQNANIETRKEYIQNELIKLQTKYENSGYNLLSN